MVVPVRQRFTLLSIVSGSSSIYQGENPPAGFFPWDPPATSGFRFKLRASASEAMPGFRWFVLNPGIVLKKI